MKKEKYFLVIKKTYSKILLNDFAFNSNIEILLKLLIILLL